MANKVTLEEISLEAGVSNATVSRVINTKENVSPRTRERVLNAMIKLGYNHEIIKNRSKDLKIIAVLTTGSNGLFFQEIISAIQKTALGADYDVIWIQTDLGPNQAKRLADHINNGLVAGVITAINIPELYDFLSYFKTNIPLVQCCEYDDKLPYPFVAIDDFTSSFQAVSYLISTGRKRIALFNHTLSTSHGYYREEGYKAALKKHNIPLDQSLIYRLNMVEFNLAHAAARDIFVSTDYPDAFFCVNDVFAAAVIQSAFSHNISVPKDVAVIGFDNTEISQMTTPSITTVNQPKKSLGSAACSLLLEMIEGKKPRAMKTFMDGQLIVREST